MRRLGIVWVVLLTIGILVVSMAGGATPRVRAQADDCKTAPSAPTPGETSPPIAFKGPGTYTFTAGNADGGFTVNSDGGSQATSISITTGILPSGLTCDAPAWDGVLSVWGTPDRGTGGTYQLKFTAYNQYGASATEAFTLTVDEAPAITSANGTTFTVGTAGAFTVKAIGYPTPSISKFGPLPSGVIFRQNGDGTATLSGNPDGSTGGTYPLTISAVNGVLPGATQSFILTTVLPTPETPTAPRTSAAPTAPRTSAAPTAPRTSAAPTAPRTSQSSSSAALWGLAAAAAIGVLIAVITGAVIRHHAKLRKRIRAVPHPEAGAVNLDRSEPTLAHTVRLEPHSDRGTTYLEDEP